MSFENLKGRELFKYLREHKSELISAKKSAIKFTDGVTAKVTPVSPTKTTKVSTTKVDTGETPVEPTGETGKLPVTVVCNTAWFCDSQMDVLTDTAYDESITTKGNSIPHIADHQQKSTAHVGDVTRVSKQVLPLKELGLTQEGSTTALVMETIIREDYNEDVFKFYQNGKINQHSIGLNYGELLLAIDSNHEDDVEEKAVWDLYYPNIINKEVVDKHGYFWAVPKADIVENSCVLFGSNSLTPTLSTKSATKEEESVITQQEGTDMTTKTVEQLQAEVISLTTELQTTKAALASSEAKGRQEEQERIMGIIKAGETFTTPLSDVSKIVSDGYTVKQATNILEMLKEREQTKSAINTTMTTSLGITTKDNETEPEGTKVVTMAEYKAAGVC